MALIVETGSGVSGANSYSSLADANIYVADHGLDGSWSGTDAEKEESLIVATQYLDLVYGPRLNGQKAARDNSLIWPVKNMVDIYGYSWGTDEVPNNVKYATIELAVAVRSGDDLLGSLDGAGSIKRESVKVGPITDTTEYMGGKSQLKSYPKVDMLMKPFLMSGNQLARC